MPKVSTGAAKATTGDSTKAKRKTRAAPRGTKSTAGKPKRALSAYMFFSQDWRERIKTENPDASFGEIGKLLGAKWKEMSDEEKKPYATMASADKVRAEKEKGELTEAAEDKPEKPDKTEKTEKEKPAKAVSPVDEDDDDD